MDLTDDVLIEFIAESRENLDAVERDLVQLERAPSDKLVAAIFRAIHTVKGTAGFFGLEHTQAVSHAAESLLDRVRGGELAMSPEIATALLRTCDALRHLLDSIEHTADEGDPDNAELIAWMGRLQEGPAAAPPAPAVSPAAPSPPAAAAAPPPPVAAAVAPPLPAAAAPPPPPPPAAPAASPPPAETSLRVDVALLDRLMTQVGELVLARNQINQYATRSGDPGFVATCQRLSAITTDLQEHIMRTRLQPIGHVLGKVPRQVRDLAAVTGKQVRVEISGEETELDRSLVEAIRDPLMHLVRNSIDHGLESPDGRAAAGKPPEGLVRVAARHDSGGVTVEISDDGRGIDPERIKARAVQRGLVTAEQAAHLGPQQLTELIFLPGFSTAEAVTSISGRGVGMDVVKTNVERLGGVVDIESRVGAGTTFRIELPLTLAILPVLIVELAGDRYALPQTAVVELVRFGPAAEHRLEQLHGAPVLRLRERLLPLVPLRRALALGDELPPHGHVVVVGAEGRQFGVIVDRVLDTEEIVVKPLSAQLQRVPVYAGATILGDGGIALILDVRGLAAVARVQGRAAEPAPDQAAPAARPPERLLLFRIGDRRFAASLVDAVRIEHVPAERFGFAGDGRVFRSGGALLPVVDLAALLGVAGAGVAGAVPVLVCRDAAGDVGLAVDEVVDVIEFGGAVAVGGQRPGFAGSFVAHERVTELLRLGELVPIARGLA